MITRITASPKRRFLALWFRRRLGRAGEAPACLVAYLPQRQQGWILDFLWRDLCEQLRRQPGPAVGVVATAAELWTRSRGTDLMVLAMSPDALNALIALGFPPERIVFYHTHVRLGLPMQKLDLLHAVLVLNGADDPMVSDESLVAFKKEMDAVDADWQLTHFGGAVHSFTAPNADMPGRAMYDAKVARRAFAAMDDLFDEVFG